MFLLHHSRSAIFQTSLEGARLASPRIFGARSTNEADLLFFGLVLPLLSVFGWVKKNQRRGSQLKRQILFIFSFTFLRHKGCLENFGVHVFDPNHRMSLASSQVGVRRHPLVIWRLTLQIPQRQTKLSINSRTGRSGVPVAKSQAITNSINQFLVLPK